MDNKYNFFTPSNELYMAIIAILIAILFIFEHVLTGSIVLVLFCILVIYNIKNTKIKKDEWQKFIEDFSSQLDLATRNTLVKLPFPLFIVGYNGNILWYNQNVAAILDSSTLLGKNITEIIKDFNINLVINGKKIKFKNIQINNNYYDIYTNIVDTSDEKSDKEKIILIYLYDVTQFVNMEKNIDDNRECVILLEVDNMDEVIRSVEEDKKPLLIAGVERTLNSYAQNLNAMLKKYSANKYVMTVQEKYINIEMDKKFDILDTIREIDFGNKLEVTLSMGIGKGGKSPLENHKYAISAKDLALGRGGDQVVIKNEDKLSFYGGKTKEVEKRTKVRARVIAHSLLELINESSKVFIMGHINPDIDCLGAAIGIHNVCKTLGKENYIVLDEINKGIKLIMNKITQDEEYQHAFMSSEKCKVAMDENSILIIVDAHNESNVLNMDLVRKSKKMVIIDHHRKAQDFIKGALLSYIEPYASSASELVTEMIEYMVEKPKLKQIEAEALLAGICVDTKNFYFKTGVRTFEAASFLRRLGADTIDVKNFFADDLDTYLKRGSIIRSAEIVNNVAIAICPPEIEDNVLAAQAADELLNITGIHASFVIVKIEDAVLISGRSLGNINVQVILESLGGGGHMAIAGARLKDATIEETLEMLKNAIDKYLQEVEV